MPITTYIPIVTRTLDTAQASVTLSNIPNTFSHLVLEFNGTLSTAVSPTFRINSDFGTNYSATTISASGSGTPGSTRNSAAAWGGLGAFYAVVNANTPFNMKINIQRYSDSSAYKTLLTRLNNSAQYSEITVGMWRNTAPVTSITLNGWNDGGQYAIGSTFTLYGIA